MDYQKELTRVRAELARELNKSVRGYTTRAAQEAAKGQGKLLSMMFERAELDVGDHFTTALSQVQKNVVADIVSGGLYKDNKTLSNRIWQATGDNKKDIETIIAQGITEKKSATKLAEDLEQFVKPAAERPSNWGKAYPMLAYKNIDYNAMRLARTSINHAYQNATIQSSGMNPFVEGIEWQSALIHGRTCQICIDRHGVIFPKDDVPLDHPNGLCSMLPYIPKSLDEVAEELNSWIYGEENPMLDTWYKEYGKNFNGVKNIMKGNITKEIAEEVVEEVVEEGPRYKSTDEVFKKVTYTGIEDEYAKEIDARFLDLQNKYPINEGNITIKTAKAKNKFGHSKGQIVTRKRGGKDMLFYEDEIIISNVHHATKERSLNTHISNYKRRGSKLRSGISTIDHEYAHAIDNYYLQLKNKSLKDMADTYRKGVEYSKWDGNTVNLVNQFNRDMYINPDKMSEKVYATIRDELKIDNIEMYNNINSELGSYAASDRSEFLAEGFANMRLLKDEEKTPFIKKFEEVFNREFDEVIRNAKP
jgi:hypothetical protein